MEISYSLNILVWYNWKRVAVGLRILIKLRFMCLLIKLMEYSEIEMLSATFMLYWKQKSNSLFLLHSNPFSPWFLITSFSFILLSKRSWQCLHLKKSFTCDGWEAEFVRSDRNALQDQGRIESEVHASTANFQCAVNCPSCCEMIPHNSFSYMPKPILLAVNVPRSLQNITRSFYMRKLENLT